MTSFKVTKSGTQLVNRAMDLIAENHIPSLDDQVSGVAARTARTWYKPTVAWLLERHHWGLATRREPLTVTTNDRSTQWLYAYQVPEDAAFIKRVVPPMGGSVGYYAGIRSLLLRNQFERIGALLYSSVQAAALDFTSYTVDETEFSEELSDIIVLMLASRFAIPIAKKAALQDKYLRQAEGALDVALARSRNENEPTYGDTPTETELVRGAGYGVGVFDREWPAV